jgi:hypothetical protein
MASEPTTTRAAPRLLVPALLCLLLAAACTRTTLQASVADKHGGSDEMTEMNFWDALALEPAVSNRDALHALLLSFGGEGTGRGYPAELAAAKKRGWVEEDLPANETARVGFVARVVCLQAKIKGGITMRVFGPHDRYAVKELNHRKWLPDMTTGQSISGAQLIAVLSRAEEHLAGTTKSAPKEDL